MGHWHNVLIVVWGVDASMPLLAEYSKLLAHVTQTQGLFSIVHIAPTARPLPSPEVRAAFATIADQFSADMTYTAVMIAGGGFWLSAVRSLITSMQVIVRRRFKAKICSTTEEVAAWLAGPHSTETRHPIDPDQLRVALDWMIDQPSVRDFRAP
ncbi:MAG: hypothetical protein ABW321_31650 [Polyangiales bacterium]